MKKSKKPSAEDAPVIEAKHKKAKPDAPASIRKKPERKVNLSFAPTKMGRPI
jgi:hypothetical protein